MNICNNTPLYRSIYLYIYILERLHNGSCFRRGAFAWSEVRRRVLKLRDMWTLAKELKRSHFLKSLDVWLEQAPERDSVFARRGHRNTFENSFGKDATTITAQAKGVAFWKVGARLRRPTEGVAKATLRSCAGRFVRRGSPKPNLKTYKKRHQKPPWKEVFEVSGRICGGTLSLANN